jgi:membrane protein DedA with SNARE-associated domain
MEEIHRMLAEHGLALVFGNVLLTQLGAPLPAVPMLIVAGAYTQQGDFTAGGIVAAAVLASLLGDLAWYLAGRRYGYRVLAFLCRMAVEPGVCVQRTEDKLGRWGAPSLVIAKFVPGFATVAPPLAGATRLPLPSFLFYSAVGAALWAGASVAAGGLFRNQVEDVIAWIESAGLRAAVVLAVLLALYIVLKWAQRLVFIRQLRMSRITAPQLHALTLAGQAPLVLDARSEAARRADPRRIPGAIPVDLQMPELTAAHAPLDRDVVVYCT